MKNMENISFERSGLLVRRKFREYLAPTILTTISMSLAAIVDGVLVGNILGDRALSAVGLSIPIIYCMNMLFFLFAHACRYVHGVD